MKEDNKLKLERAYLDNSTIGKLYYKGVKVCYTVERAWLNNQRSISCIPAGTYKLIPFSSKKHPKCFLLQNEMLNVGISHTHRTACLIHIANFPHEINGCIAPGLELHPTKWGVAQSRKAMDILRDLIAENNITKLEIV